MQLQLVQSVAYEQLIPLLMDADEGAERIRALLCDQSHQSYFVMEDEQVIGVVTMRWDEVESEIIYIAVQEALRGRGYGKRIMAQLLDEAKRRQVHSLIVGTANTGWETIHFYQRCGFRMDHVRLDYFAYIQPLLTVDGVLMQDMLVLRHRLGRE